MRLLRGVLTCLVAILFNFSGLACTFSDNSVVPGQADASDPAELMRLAATVSGPIFPGAQPWHLKASYEVLDTSGHRVGDGIYEFFWAAPGKFKRSFASKSFSQTDYMTDKGVVRVGDMRGASGPERVVASKLLLRMPGEGMIRNTSQQLNPQKIDGQTYRCVTFNSRTPVATIAVTVLPVYCFDADRLALRRERGTGIVSSELSGETEFNDILVFHGHFVATDIRVSHYDKPYLHIHVDALEDIAQVTDADFQPPANALPAPPQRTVVNNNEMTARLIHRQEPAGMRVFSDAGKDERVILSIIVGKDGAVISIRPIGGWKDLQSLTAKAVKQWVYRPCLINGQPVEVESEVIESFEGRASWNPR